jgi:hypothetical protein
MQERILPYLGFAYERDLIEYVGTVLVTPTITQLTSPGVTVYKEAAGIFQIYLDDKVPLWPQLMSGQPSSQDLSYIDEGFSPTVICQTNLRAEGPIGDIYHIKNSSAFFVTPGEKQIAFKVWSFRNGVAADLPFCFRILISGQPTKFVQGAGA